MKINSIRPINTKFKLKTISKTQVTNPITVSFTAQCSEKDFRLKDVPNLHCPVCGLVMLNAEQRKEFVDDVAPKTGESLIETLSKYEDETALVGDSPLNEHKTIYRPLKAKIIEVIKQAARQNPKLNLLQLVQLKRNEFLAPLIKQQLTITAEIEDYIEQAEMTDEEKKKTKGILEEFKSQILGESEVEFKRQNYIHALSNVTSNTVAQEKINTIIECLPQSNNDVNSFFVKYSKEAKSSREIASKFVDQSISTAEHLKPKSKGGKNNTNNYICDCAECNSARMNTDFDEWLRQKPELEGNLQKYLVTVQQIIDEGNFPVAYDNYISEVVKTLKKLSYGKLKLKAPKSNNPRINDATYVKRAQELENIKRKMGELYRRKEELKEKIRNLEENAQFYNIVQLELVKKQIENTEKRVLSLSEDLSVSQRSREEALKTLDEITLLQIHLSQGDESAREKIIELDEKATKAKLDEAEAKINARTSSIETLNNNLNKLRKKEKQLAKLVISDDEVEEQVKEISEILANYNSINFRINALKDEIFDEKAVADALKNLKNEMVRIRIQNYNLKKQNGGRNFTDRTDYDKYLSELKLFDAGSELLEFFNQQSSKMPSQTPKIVELAQNSIRENIEELSKKDSVQYFSNIDMLKALDEEKEILIERLREIELVKEQIKAFEEKAKESLKGRTFEQLNAELESLTQTKQTVFDIKHVSEVRTELEIIEDTISYNENVLRQLRNFKQMSTEQFQEYINMIFY